MYIKIPFVPPFRAISCTIFYKKKTRHESRQLHIAKKNLKGKRSNVRTPNIRNLCPSERKNRHSHAALISKIIFIQFLFWIEKKWKIKIKTNSVSTRGSSSNPKKDERTQTSAVTPDKNGKKERWYHH